MNLKLFFSCAAIVILTAPVSGYEELVKQAEFEYEVMVEESMKSVKQLDSLYLENLETLRKKESQRGALDSVLTIQKISEAIEEGRPAPSVDPSMPELSRLHTIYTENREKRLKAAEPTLQQLKKKHIQRLEEYVVVLTREEKIDEAVRLRKVIEAKKKEGGAEPVAKAEPSASDREFDLETGTFCGTQFGDTEQEVRDKMEKAGLPLKGESKVTGRGKNITQPIGVNFRINNEGKYYENYLLGVNTPIKGGLRLRKSTVEDFEKVLDARAREDDPKRYRIRTRNCEVLLIKEKESDSAVFSVMVSER